VSLASVTASAGLAVYVACANFGQRRQDRNVSRALAVSSPLGGRPRGAVSVLSDAAVWEAFRTFLLVDCDSPPSTVSEYRYVIWDWLAFLALLGRPWHKATRRDLANYLNRPTRSGRAKGNRLAPNTRLHYGATVKAFYAFAYAAELVRRDPMAAFKLPRGGVPVPRSLPQPEVRQILLAAEHDERLNLMAWMAYGQACRVGEIAASRIEDVDLGGPLPRIIIHGKGAHDRVLPLHPGVRAAIVRTLASQGHPRVGPLVASRARPTEPLSAAGVSRVLSELIHGLGIDASAHALRHSAATEMLAAAKGRNLEIVREFLGHKDTRTTRIYVARYPWQLEEAVPLIPDPVRPKARR
jgi:integrase/recombinase XerC